MPLLKISQLTTATAVSATNQFEINQNGASRSAEASVLATYVRTSAVTPVIVAAGTAAAPAIYPTGDPNTGIFFPAADTIAFAEGGAERARITSNGALLVGVSVAPIGDSNVLTGPGQTDVDWALHVRQLSGTGEARGILSQTPNYTGDDGYLFEGRRGTDTRFVVYSNGNVQNTNNSYGSLSDIKLKENVVNATPKLDAVKKVRVVNYNLKGDAQKQIGVIAQELEAIFPGLIQETPERGGNGTVKSVKYSVFVPILIKAMQEQQALIESLAARIAALEARS